MSSRNNASVPRFLAEIVFCMLFAAIEVNM